MSGSEPTESATVKALKGILEAAGKSAEAARGKHTIQGASIRATFAAYQQLGSAADAIAEEIRANQAWRPVLLQGGESVADFGEYRAFLQRAKKLEETLKADLEKARKVFPKESAGLDVGALGFVGSAPIIGAVVQAAFAFGASLLRTDVVETHTAVTIDDNVLVNWVAMELATRSIETILPTEAATATPSDKAELPLLLTSLESLTQALRSCLALTDARLALKDEAEKAKERRPFVELRPRLDAAVKSFEAFWTALGAQSGKLLRTAAILEKLGNDGIILGLRVLAGGATTHSPTSGYAAETDISGGVLVSYAVITQSGHLERWRTLERYGEFEPGSAEKFGDMRRRPFIGT
jgi:hypothetical protein